MSALLYIPPGATAQTPAPGILATGHRCIISREIQDGFAIEFARRGYVVLAALHRHRHPVRAAVGDRSRHCDLHLAAYRLEPPGALICGAFVT